MSESDAISEWLEIVANCGRGCQRVDMQVYPKRHLKVGAWTWVMCQINTSSLVYYYFRCVGLYQSMFAVIIIRLRVPLHEALCCDRGTNLLPGGVVASLSPHVRFLHSVELRMG